jgi:mannonate dehydratase
MKMTFRWFGKQDAVSLEQIRQIPGVTGVVSALYDIPVGEVWPREEIEQLQYEIAAAGLNLTVIESVPVHEDIKLGRPTADRLTDQYAETIRNIGKCGVHVLCYNFMPVFDWTRTDLAMRLPDGSTALAYDDHALAQIDLSRGTGKLPGWATAYGPEEVAKLLDAYSRVDDEQLWENLTRFLERVVPIAESSGVKLAIHPDDPPWSIFGLPRIITNTAALDRVVSLVDSPANGITFCTGSLGASADNPLPAMARRFGAMNLIHFVHCRNVKRTNEHDFHEVPHPSQFGDVDMREVLQALVETGYDGPIRPDHGRMIWNETGRPGYGLYDRALGATYLYGLWEGLNGRGKN